MFSLRYVSRSSVSEGNELERISSRTLPLLKKCYSYTMKFIAWSLVGIVIFFALYYALASPPLHWFYDAAVEDPGSKSVYIPGGGFSGFWFHLGYLQSLPNLSKYDYYCYSSGCLGILSAILHDDLDTVANIAFEAQSEWSTGNITRFDVTGHFIDSLMAHPSSSPRRMKKYFRKLNILVTTTKNGYEIRQPSNMEELKDLIIKTTWVPYLTGWGLMGDESDMYFDGGFSRLLHPMCSWSLHLPVTWDFIMNTFSPSLTREKIRVLWDEGSSFDFGMN